LENGADLHTENDLALQYAARKGHLEVCKFLLENGANLEALFTKKGNPTKSDDLIIQ